MQSVKCMVQKAAVCSFCQDNPKTLNKMKRLGVN